MSLQSKCPTSPKNCSPNGYSPNRSGPKAGWVLLEHLRCWNLFHQNELIESEAPHRFALRQKFEIEPGRTRNKRVKVWDWNLDRVHSETGLCKVTFVDELWYCKKPFHKSSSVSSSASSSAPHVSTPPNYLTSPQPFYNKTHDCHKTFV